MAEEPRRAPRDHLWLTPQRWLSLCALSLGLLILSALLRGAREDIGWYLWHVLPGVAVVAFCATALGRLVGTVSLLAYAALLPMLTLLVGVDVINPWSDGVRLQLFADNPNLLGADLVIVTLAAMLVLPRLPWGPWVPLAALAVVFTGSRTALLAIGTASAVWLISPLVGWRSRFALLGGAVLVASLLSFASVQHRLEDASSNLLRVSTTFSDPVWNDRYAASFSVERGAARGPTGRARADRLTASTTDQVLTLVQSGERSVEGAPYVASVYLRSDSPQRVVLSSHLSRTTCEVNEEWRRCTTPAGYGDGRLMAQFRFEVHDAGDGYDLFAFGPQLERSTEPSAYSPKGVAPISRRLMDRFLSTGFADWRTDARWTAMADTWSTFITTPWLGAGQSRLASHSLTAGSPASVSPADHGHNLLLHRLASDGVLGALAWVLLVVPLMHTVLAHGRRPVLPWFVGILVLNLFDMTLFHSGSYFASAVALGVVMGETWRRPQTPWAEHQ